jgi:general secretion pathway protein G
MSNLLCCLTSRRGVSLIELIVTMVILGILASVVLPMSQMTARRTREIELRRTLRQIRTAIDDYKKSYDDAVQKGQLPQVLNKSGCPETLEQLVKGDNFGGMATKKFLRKVPSDPMNPPAPGEDPKWGLRSYADKPDSSSWGGEDVYDVYSLSEGTAIDGTKYKDW